MKIDKAYLCHSCGEIQKGAPAGKCEKCQSGEIIALAWHLNGPG